MTLAELLEQGQLQFKQKTPYLNINGSQFNPPGYQQVRSQEPPQQLMSMLLQPQQGQQDDGYQKTMGEMSRIQQATGAGKSSPGFVSRILGGGGSKGGSEGGKSGGIASILGALI